LIDEKTRDQKSRATVTLISEQVGLIDEKTRDRKSRATVTLISEQVGLIYEKTRDRKSRATVTLNYPHRIIMHLYFNLCRTFTKNVKIQCTTTHYW
jgi:hypothetical protein